MNINVTNWYDFDIFYNEETKTGLFQVDVGGDTADVTNKVVMTGNEEDKVFIISNKGINNGIEGVVEGAKTNKRNVITLATRGNDYKAFYHFDYDIITVVRALCLSPVGFELNYYLAFFICTMLNQNKTKYNYARVLSGERIKKDKIRLPAIIKDNNYIVDFQYIEKYIRGLCVKVDYSLLLNQINIRRNTYFDNKVLKSFPLIKKIEGKEDNNKNGIFEIKNHDKVDVNSTREGDFPLVARGSNNNNVHSFIEYETIIDLSNSISVNLNGAIGKCYYHQYNYVTTQNVHVLFVGGLNIERAIFLISIMEYSFKNKYLSHGRELVQKNLIKEEIKLPAKKNEHGEYEPDWQFMEDYIKSLPYSSNL